MSDEQLFLLLLGIAVIVYLAIRLSAATKKVQDLTANVNQLTMQQLNAWKETELQAIRQQESEAAHARAAVSLQAWQQESEKAIRADAHVRSKAVTTGKVLEHMAPHLPGFPYSPKDARFVGSPVDYIVFDGLDEGTLRQVVLVEVKTGSSALTTREKQIRDAVLARRVEWCEYRIGDPTPVSTPVALAPVGAAPHPPNGAVKVVLPDVGATEATVVRWLATPGAWVGKGEPLVEVETEKISLEISADTSGRLHVITGRGAVVSVGEVIGAIDPSPTD